MEILYTQGGEIKVVVVDATLKELHDHSATATQDPVEEGVAVTDHVRPEVDKLTVEVHVTNTPVVSPNVDGANGNTSGLSLSTEAHFQQKSAKVGSTGKVDNAEWSTKGVRGSAMVLQFGQDFDRVGAVYQVLQDLLRGGVELTVVTSLRQWDSMVLTRVSAPREANSRNAATFTLDFQEIRFAETETVATPEPLETRAEHAASRGAQGAEDPESEEDVSLAAQLLESATGTQLIHQPRRSGSGIFTR